ncbi:hypothetical protein QR680_006579 [Steinernema hermaphroditum]|uniref:Uncharacterized protein n=1 Tax=Steinernema hermaphroditum TaxID=289476 RepID=A0AA39HY95_9BILA|nr:hypothetical protein QR680_006579 [Steinernema hermaphroditum]
MVRGPGTLLWLLPVLLAAVAGAEPKAYEGYAPCEMWMFPKTYFHAVTCRGFARVLMDTDEAEAMNMEIDRLLTDAHGTLANKPCLKVKTFFYDNTSLLFLKHNTEGNDLSYWITPKLEPSNEFIEFPDDSQWKSLGYKGYSPETFNGMSTEEKKTAICDPEIATYNAVEKLFHFAGKRIDMDGKELGGESLHRLNADGSCNADYELTRIDVTRQSKRLVSGIKEEILDSWRVPKSMSKKREYVVFNEAYNGYILFSLQSVNNPKQYYLLANSKADKNILDGWDVCFLRDYRVDLDELPEPYMLPESAEYKLRQTVLHYHANHAKYDDYYAKYDDYFNYYRRAFDVIYTVLNNHHVAFNVYYAAFNNHRTDFYGHEDFDVYASQIYHENNENKGAFDHRTQNYWEGRNDWYPHCCCTNGW